MGGGAFKIGALTFMSAAMAGAMSAASAMDVTSNFFMMISPGLVMMSDSGLPGSGDYLSTRETCVVIEQQLTEILPPDPKGGGPGPSENRTAKSSMRGHLGECTLRR